jgi:O-methyltransferase involved in polyketide biosynthesis
LHPIPNSTDPLINDTFAAPLVNAVGIDLFSRLANAAYPAAGRRSGPKPTPHANAALSQQIQLTKQFQHHTEMRRGYEH